MISRLGRERLLTAISTFAVSCFLATGCAQKPAPETLTDVDLSQARGIFDRPVVTATPANAGSVIAVVDGEDITQADLNREVGMLLNRMRGQMPPEQVAQLRPQMLQQSMETLITKTLLRHEVAKRNIELVEGELDEAIERIQGSLRNGMTLEMFLLQAGLSEQQFRDELTMDLRINKLLEKATDETATPGEDDLQQYYAEHRDQFQKPETVRASHVLIAFEPEDDDAAKAAKRAKAEEIRERLVAGEDFAECAANESDCPSKSRGGDLGSFGRGQMVQPFEDAAFTQPEGEIGPIVETRFGYHIIKVVEHDQKREIPLDEVHDKLSDFLRAQRRQQAAQDFVKNLREGAEITYPESATQGMGL
jgi:peptidyl-prolyl cis-trans isomerase C